MEYSLLPEDYDGPDCRDQNVGCAQPLNTFFNMDAPIPPSDQYDAGRNHLRDPQPRIDPRMLMILHGPFIQ